MRASRFWIVIIGIAAMLLLVAGLGLGQRSAVKDGVFIHITKGHDDPHEVLMAMQMANLMAEDHEVLVYFDIKGVDVVLRDADSISYSHFAPSKEQLSGLLSKGATVMACPGCLKAAGKTGDDLTEGVEVADKARFFSFTQGRILTLDY